MKNLRATAVVVRNNTILMIHRYREGTEYFVLPGGHIEEETPEEAVIRELKEETSISANLDSKITEIIDEEGRKHIFFKCEYVSGEPRLDEKSSENKRMNENNQYLPKWIELSKISSITIWPEEAKEFLIKYLQNNF